MLAKPTEAATTAASKLQQQQGWCTPADSGTIVAAGQHQQQQKYNMITSKPHLIANNATINNIVREMDASIQPARHNMAECVGCCVHRLADCVYEHTYM